jgi:hypothetical protein
MQEAVTRLSCRHSRAHLTNASVRRQLRGCYNYLSWTSFRKLAVAVLECAEDFGIGDVIRFTCRPGRLAWPYLNLDA